jgi:hypothetical protein
MKASFKKKKTNFTSEQIQDASCFSSEHCVQLTRKLVMLLATYAKTQRVGDGFSIQHLLLLR